MKNRTTTNSKRRRDTVSVSLFPFLAVLICTMGVLILLLVIFTHQARLQAAEEARRKAEKEDVHVAQAREDVQGRIEQLKKTREQTMKQLAEVRLKLGLVEDHARQLHEKLKQLEATKVQMEQMQADGRKRRQLEAELAETVANIAQVEADIEETKRKIKQRARAHRPVIPFEGPRGTMRIPICVECRSDTVVIQPEGIVLTEADFDGPMGPGNPLAAALRAAREHMLASIDQGMSDGEMSAIEPYPLLLVRPDGTMSYNSVRYAMRSWGPDFGYELIDDDWKIAYGESSPQRALAMQKAIDAARLQQIRLAAAAPRHYPGRGSGPVGGRSYTTNGRGGIVAYRGTIRKSRYRTPGERLAAQRAALGGRAASGNGGYGSTGAGGMGSGYGTGSSYGTGSAQGTRNGLETGGGFGPGTSGGADVLGSGDGSGLGNGTASGTGDAGTGGQPAGDSMLGGAGGGGSATDGSMLGNGPYLNDQANIGGGQAGGGQAGGGGQADSGQADSGQAGGGQAGGGGQGGCQTAGGQPASGQISLGSPGMSQAGMTQPAGGQPAGGQPDAGQVSSMNINMSDAGSQATENGEALEDMVVRPNGYQDNNQQPGSVGAARRPGEWTPSDPRHRPTKLEDPRADKNKRAHRASSGLAGKRGKNWALPKSTPRSTPLVRPIRIDCRPDRLILVPEPGLSGRQEIVLDTYTSDSMNEFIAAVWYYMDNSWGIAGHGMYWKPILKVDVAPGAEHRYRDLQTLLEGSGLRIEKRK